MPTYSGIVHYPIPTRFSFSSSKLCIVHNVKEATNPVSAVNVNLNGFQISSFLASEVFCKRWGRLHVEIERLLSPFVLPSN